MNKRNLARLTNPLLFNERFFEFFKYNNQITATNVM